MTAVSLRNGSSAVGGDIDGHVSDHGRGLVTEISTDPVLARQVILALSIALSDVRCRARSQLITDRPITAEELDEVMNRARGWAIEQAQS